MEQKKIKRIIFGLCLVLFSILLLLEALMLETIGLHAEITAKIMISTAVISLIGFWMVYWNLNE